jgi:hypothetical protein
MYFLQASVDGVVLAIFQSYHGTSAKRTPVDGELS